MAALFFQVPMLRTLAFLQTSCPILQQSLRLYLQLCTQDPLTSYQPHHLSSWFTTPTSWIVVVASYLASVPPSLPDTPASPHLFPTEQRTWRSSNTGQILSQSYIISSQGIHFTLSNIQRPSCIIQSLHLSHCCCSNLVFCHWSHPIPVHSSPATCYSLPQTHRAFSCCRAITVPFARMLFSHAFI